MFWTIVGMLIVLFSCICIGTVYNKTVKGGKLESVSVYVTLIALAALYCLAHAFCAAVFSLPRANVPSDETMILAMFNPQCNISVLEAG